MNPPILIYRLLEGDVVASACMKCGNNVYEAEFGVFKVTAEFDEKRGSYVLRNSAEPDELLCDGTNTTLGDVRVVFDDGVIRLVREGADVCVIGFWECTILFTGTVTVRQIMYAVLLYMIEINFAKV